MYQRKTYYAHTKVSSHTASDEGSHVFATTAIITYLDSVNIYFDDYYYLEQKCRLFNLLVKRQQISWGRLIFTIALFYYRMSDAILSTSGSDSQSGK